MQVIDTQKQKIQTATSTLQIQVMGYILEND